MTLDVGECIVDEVQDHLADDVGRYHGDDQVRGAVRRAPQYRVQLGARDAERKVIPRPSSAV